MSGRILVTLVLAVACSSGRSGGSGPTTTEEGGSAGASASETSGSPGAGEAGESSAAGSGQSEGGAAEMVCEPGETQTCYCADPVRMGAQECDSSGQRWAECNCATGEGGASGSGGSGSGGAGVGGFVAEPVDCPPPTDSISLDSCLKWDGIYTCLDGSTCTRCDIDHLDCDGDPRNGCEQPQGDATCGGCSIDCTVAGGTACEYGLTSPDPIRFGWTCKYTSF